jgi:hypothetical protein
MKYFLDCEFNGFQGDLISLALVAEDGRELYLARPRFNGLDPWVQKNVEPIVTLNDACPQTEYSFSHSIAQFLRFDEQPVIIADWPDDIRYLCESLITGPGEMVKTVQRLTFVVERVDAYPTDLPGAVQHNALWDARALKFKLSQSSGDRK